VAFIALRKQSVMRNGQQIEVAAGERVPEAAAFPERILERLIKFSFLKKVDDSIADAPRSNRAPVLQKRAG
jgi:hypothetical protein